MCIIKNEYLKKSLDKLNKKFMKKLLIFLLFFIFSCQNEYIEFHQNKELEKQIQSEISDFSFEKIEYLSWITLRETPDLKLLGEITQKIDNAKSRVYVEVYIFTEKRIKKALIKAKKRWLDVKVILEKNVYLAPSLNTQTFTDFKKAWIEVVYSNQENYWLNHTKMMIIDDEIIISTGNYSYSTFKYNRDFFIFLDNKTLLLTFLEIFKNDFFWNKKNINHANLVLSPFSSRIKLEYLIKNANKSIKIYSHNFSDENILNFLLEKQKEWINIKMIFPDFKKVSSNENEVELLKKNNINLKLVDKPEIHAKAVLIDWEYLYIWSINFSSYSMDKNREIWILIKNENIIKQFLDIFNADFEK